MSTTKKNNDLFLQSTNEFCPTGGLQQIITFVTFHFSVMPRPVALIVKVLSQQILFSIHVQRASVNLRTF